ncbi:glycosyltransferase family 9 protein [Candidatus Margulisiibacteriota bacterium]
MPKKTISLSKEQIKKILVIRPDALGDLVLTLPAVQTLKKNFPQASITVLARSYTAPLLQEHPAINDVIFDYDLKKHNFDLSVNYFNEPKETMATFKAGIPYRLGDSSRIPMGWFNNLRVFRTWNDFTRHEIEFNLDLLAPLNIKDYVKKPVLKVSNQTNPHLVGIHIGSGGSNNKSWALSEYAKTIDWLINDKKAQVILLGGPDAKERAEQLVKLCQTQPVDTVGQLSLRQLIDQISQLKFYLGADTGPTHIAAALNIPMVVLFLAKRAKPLRWGPWQTRHLVVKNFSSCKKSCFPPNCKEDIICIEEIKAAEVIRACETVLAGGGVKDQTETFRHWCQKSFSVTLVDNSPEKKRGQHLLELLQAAGYHAQLVSETNPKKLLNHFISYDTSVIHQVGGKGSLAIKIAWQLTGSYLCNRALLIRDQGEKYSQGQELIDQYVLQFRQQVL